MPTGNFLNDTFGGGDSERFKIGEITNLYLVPRSKVISMTQVKSDFGSVNSVTDITLAPDAKFQEIGFDETTGTYTDVYKEANGSKYMEQAVNFSVSTGGIGANLKAEQILMGKYMALVVDGDGSLKLLGVTKGLKAATDGATANASDAGSAMTFTLTGKNLGFAADLVMDALDLDALLNKIV